MKRQPTRYTAPQQFLDEAAVVAAQHAQERGDVDFAGAQRRRIAEREDDYHKQGRERGCLSPPKKDPYAALQRPRRVPKRKSAPAAATAAAVSEERTYRDAMREHELEHEEAAVALELKRRRRDEEAERARELAAREEKLRQQEAEVERGTRPSTCWYLTVMKDGKTLEQIDLWSASKANGDGSVHIGKMPGCDVQLLHPSCSECHAKIRMPQTTLCDGSEPDACPRIVDLRSEYGTFVHGTRLRPGVYVPLNDGLIVTFVASRRQYIVMKR